MDFDLDFVLWPPTEFGIRFPNPGRGNHVERFYMRVLLPMFLRELNGEGEETSEGQATEATGRAVLPRDWDYYLEYQQCRRDRFRPAEGDERPGPDPRWRDLGGAVWYEHPESLFPIVITQGITPTGFLLLMAAPFTDLGVDYEVACLFVRPGWQRPQMARALVLAALDRFEGTWNAVPCVVTDALALWAAILSERFLEFSPDPYGDFFLFDNVPPNRRGQIPPGTHEDETGNARENWVVVKCRQFLVGQARVAVGKAADFSRHSCGLRGGVLVA